MKSEILPHLKKVSDYTLSIIKWLFCSLLIGISCGITGALFHHSVDEASHLRAQFPFILFFLPVAGLGIVFLYHICKMDNDKGTNAIISAVRNREEVPFAMLPLIFVGTVLTHFCGGSSGREGAALQIGGSLGSLWGKLFKVKNHTLPIFIMCGMSGLFSAVFATPITAAIFSLEVVSVGIMHYGALFPCLMSALVANIVSENFGVAQTGFALLEIPVIDSFIIIKVLIIAVLAAIMSIVFIFTMHKSKALFSKYIKNKYARIVTGGLLVIVLTLIVGNTKYNGAGMEVITIALEEGRADSFAFLLKLILTAVTLSAGFKGGEIVPTFYIGATFGVFIAPIIGLNPSFAAAIALVSMFCGVVNCPIASLFLGFELFGSAGVMYYAITVAVSYIISGYYSLYTSQKIVYSKLNFVLDNDSSQ